MNAFIFMKKGKVQWNPLRRTEKIVMATIKETTNAAGHEIGLKLIIIIKRKTSDCSLGTNVKITEGAGAYRRSFKIRHWQSFTFCFCNKLLGNKIKTSFWRSGAFFYVSDHFFYVNKYFIVDESLKVVSGCWIVPPTNFLKRLHQFSVSFVWPKKISYRTGSDVCWVTDGVWEKEEVNKQQEECLRVNQPSGI